MSIIFLLLLLLLSSCSPSGENGVFTVASWNAYCFFDGVDNSTEYTEFTSSSGYTRAKYIQRVEDAALYMAANMGDSDIIILQEIESSDVLYDLLEAGLKDIGFMYYGLAQAEDGILSVGFVSKTKPSSFRFHSTETSRPIAEINLLVDGNMVTIFAVHLKSQLNEDVERKEELALIETLVEERAGENIIVIGDFNTDCRTGGEMGDGKSRAEYVLNLTGDGFRAYNGVLFSPYLDYSSPLECGSYYYSGDWYSYDNALLSSAFFDGDGIEYLDFRIVSPAEAKNTSGIPVKYDKSTGTGYSDHFAIMLRCEYN